MRPGVFGVLGVFGAFVASALALAGCTSSAISDSVGSISDILSSPIESSSDSSGAGATAYLGDVETLVLAFLEAPADSGSFLRELSRVAAEHGIGDWEAEPRTLEAVGAGLRRGGASPATRDAFVLRHLGALPAAGDLVRRGYAPPPAA